MEPIQPIAPDRSVPRVEPTYLTPLEREREKQRRDERRRRQNTAQAARDDASPASEPRPSNDAVEPNSGIDVRV